MKKNYSFCSPFFIILVLCLITLYGCKPKAKPDLAFKKLVATGYAHQEKGDALLVQKENKNAFLEYSKAIEYYASAQDSNRLVYSLLQMAVIEKEYDDYIELQATSVEARKYINKNLEPDNILSIYNNLGISYCQLEDYPRALFNYTKSLTLTKKAEARLTLQNNIAYVYICDLQFRKAYAILKKAVATPDIDKYPNTKAMLLSNLGYSGFFCNVPNSDKIIQEALATKLSHKEFSGAITSYLQLAKIAVTSDKQKAVTYAKQADALAQKIGAADDRLLALDILIQNDATTTGTSYPKTYTKLSGSLYRSRRKARNVLADIKYNYTSEREGRLKSEAQTAIAEAGALKQKQRLWALFLFSTAVIAAGVVGIRKYAKKSRKQRLKAVYDSESRLAEKLHDELANDMHQLMVFSENADLSNADNKEKLIQEIDDVYKRTRDISRDNGRIATDGTFELQLRELISKYLNSNCLILSKGLDTVDWKPLEEQQLITVYRCVQELLVNMRKHSKCSHALLQFETDRNYFHLKYSDNGDGFTGTKTKNGLGIMENRILALKGSFTFGPGAEKGFQATIKFPL